MLKGPHCRSTSYRGHGHRGFSVLELMTAVLISLILTALAIPVIGTMQRSFRIAGDGRDINGAIALAKMRAAADFTQARFYADLGANPPQFRVETWRKPVGSTAGCWVTEGTSVCSSSYSSPSTPPGSPLSQGVSFGFGGLGSAPPNTQSTLAQAPLCLEDDLSSTYANTACIVFNSRGIPVDSTGTPTANDAIYVTDGESVYGVTVSAPGLLRTWRSDAQTAGWTNR
jgi:prepilin-type N-terminal cleavage/methylation domain-containing protein